jgi:hypothetical protein
MIFYFSCSNLVLRNLRFSTSAPLVLSMVLPLRSSAPLLALALALAHLSLAYALLRFPWFCHSGHLRHIEAARLRGLYSRTVTNDFFSDYPRRAPFQPGFSEYGATNLWDGFAYGIFAACCNLRMLRKLNLRGILRDIRDALRQLQDAYSEELDLDGSDTSSQGSIEPDESTKHELAEERSQLRTKSVRSGAEQRSASGCTVRIKMTRSTNSAKNRTRAIQITRRRTQKRHAHAQDYAITMSKLFESEAMTHIESGVGDLVQRATM